jgi:ABC transport system ATP-binding/permease protein
MALIQINEISIGFRGPPLLDDVTCAIEAGQRIGLLGRNGSGKTTLMRMLCGTVQPDHGQIVMAPGTRLSLLTQDVPQDIAGTVSEIVAQGLPPHDHDEQNAWKLEQRVDQVIARMSLDADARFESLSSGMKRRALLAKTLVAKPDVLLLDEPTNHLDIDAISWLEDFLARWNATLIFVTHDRAFLRNLATRILEIDRGQIFDWSCDYATFLERKEAALAAEDKQNALFDKRLAQEEVWIRQGIKARRTRNEGRVRALEKMRVERSERRSSTGKAKILIQEAQRSGNLVAEVDGVSFAYGEQSIVDDFSTTLMRGDKVGIIGPNGAGKTTLLRILLGELAPQLGKVRLGTNLQIAYFDQLRQQLDEEKTVAENVAGGNDSVQVNGQSQHIIGYLQNFLFAPERARSPVRFLSGGERNRVLLARLFSQPANVIVLDEPTNDLDAETLELLEDKLVEFSGTILLVSHDREFLNNVVTSSIVFEPEGVREYVGGYDDWQRQRAESSASAPSSLRATATASAPSGGTKTKSRKSTPEAGGGSRRLGFKEQRELDQLPAAIESLETEIVELHNTMAQPDFYKQPGPQIAERQKRLKAAETRLAASLKRWEELESLR